MELDIHLQLSLSEAASTCKPQDVSLQEASVTFTIPDTRQYYTVHIMDTPQTSTDCHSQSYATVQVRYFESNSFISFWS